MERIFVYGTLKRGQYFHDKYLAGVGIFCGVGRTSHDYTLYVDALPFMVREKSDNSVKGELYDVDKETLKRLDDLEIEFKREKIEVMNEEGVVEKVWAYMYPNVFKGKPHILKEYEWE